MDDRRGRTLQYGHLGTATYLPDVQSWEFSRVTNKSRTLTYLRGTTTSHPENYPNDGLLHEEGNVSSKKTENFLLDAYPQLAPTLGVVGQHEASSQAVTESINKFDPLVSTRCALGHSSIVTGNRAREQTVPIAVFAPPEYPGSLSLYPLTSNNVDVPLDFVSSVDVPRVDYGVNARWTGSGSPILEVIASEPLDEKGVFFAVRFSLSTVVLRPLYQWPSPYGHDTRGYDDQQGSISPNQLIEIPNALTGSHPHAGVTFNPWYQEQFGIVDGAGNWSLWELHGRQPHKGVWYAEPGASGSLDTLPAELPSTGAEYYDGWATILWVGNVHQLLVCNRRTVALFRTDAYPPEAHVVNIPFERQSEWVLSVARSKHNPAHVFVITNTRVFWVAVTDDLEYNAQTEKRSWVLLSWRHFRDTEDTSITQSCALIQNEIYLVLYSRLNALAQLYTFSMSQQDVTVPVSVSDPTILSLPQAGDNHEAAVGNMYSSILLKDLERAATPVPSNNGESMRIIKFIGQCTDLRIVESLYSTTMEEGDEFGESIPADSIYPLEKSEIVSMLSSRRAADDGFIAEDQANPHLAGPSRGQMRVVRGRDRSENWEKRHGSILTVIENAFSHTTSQSQPNNFVDWLGTLSETLRGFGREDEWTRGSRTMLDIFGNIPIINDIDENPHQLENALKDIFGEEGDMLPGSGLVYLPLPISSGSSLSTAYLPTASYILGIPRLYDSLVRDWLSPLPERVPGKVRIFKESIIRAVVTELVMSRIVISPPGEDDEGAESSSGKAASSSQVEAESSQVKHHIPSSSLPTIPSSEDIHFIPSSQSTHPHAAEMGTWNDSVLRRYTSLNRFPPAPKRLTNTLSHWRVGSDPSTYDWQTTIRTLQQDEESQAEGSHATQRRKRRQERKKKAQLERDSRMSNASSSVPPVVRVGGSQPEETFETKPKPMSSSQVVEEPTTMSQTVRGQFGSRDMGRKRPVGPKKKKRAAGF